MDFQQFLDDIKQAVTVLAKNSLKDFVGAAKEDAEDFLTDTRDDLKRWTAALAEQKLTKSEFEFLLGMRAANARMHALTQIGVTKAKAQRFRDGLVSIIVKAATKLI